MGAELADRTVLGTQSSAAVLAADGVVIRDRFLSPGARRALVRCAAARRAAGSFRPAHVGHGADRVRREEVRGDWIAWLEPPARAAECRLLSQLEALRLELNRAAWLGLFDLELHYAWYPPGASYARHLDQPRGRHARRVSMVLYLNESWRPEDGGALRIHAGERSQDILPLGGRLVLFSSPTCEHEVLPTAKPRWSLSGWFRTRDAAPYDLRL